MVRVLKEKPEDLDDLDDLEAWRACVTVLFLVLRANVGARMIGDSTMWLQDI